ncbi:MFS transporter [Fulvivirga kasyanovii]|uniref:DHA2 family efflux MFS transporter permease subunit n=1 Tax=Fulvivirga kasyanovii TaxID=396812 RepID=A0ABW9RSG2_9BACT|nr:MFS transporter [Fulvivirga kasyanovii]MTI26651.1 DHA2 family efflux MFS transporter permease subunit [Fulvivirga kasyanovii]
MLSNTQQKATLIATIMASSMAFIDSTALNVALPALQSDLDMKGSSLLWVINSYALFLSALLLTGGSLGDRYGRKKVFIGGIILFSIASVLCGLSTSSTMLILSRSLQGIGGALMVPGSLSIISALFPKEERGKAIGTWSMFSAMTTVFGPALGGWLAGMGLWRLVFFINIPLAVIALFFLRKVPESRDVHAYKSDNLGALFATLALACLTYGFIEAPNYGFNTPRIFVSLLAGFLLLIVFVLREKKASSPMMSLSLFRSKTFSSTNTITLFIYAALGGFLFFFPLNLIQVQGYPAEIAGLVMLPFGLLIAFLSRWSGHLADKIGARTPLIIGSMVTAIGFYLFSIPGITAGPSDFWETFFPAILTIGIGMGLTVAPLTTAVMNAVPQDKTGSASGINNTIARTAGVLAIAIMGAFGVITFKSSFQENTAQLELSGPLQKQLNEEIPKLAEARPPEGTTKEEKQIINSAVKLSFIETFRQSALIACILAGLSVFTAYYFIPKKR